MLKARWRPVAFYKNWVKVLCITHLLDSDSDDLHVILSACSGVQKLALPLLGQVDDALASSGLRPMELSLDARATRRSDGSDRFDSPLFQNVTHLQLLLWGMSDSDYFKFNMARLQALQNLTHLSLLDLHGDLPQMLDLPDSIMVYIVFRYRAPIWDIPQDPRVVIAALSYDQGSELIETVLWRDLVDLHYFASQWGRHSDRDFVDMWEEAEKIVQIQRRNKMQHLDP
ncbi:hypothetical protein C8J56DRAFT_1156768 [Mycena floridula]|nr:hypothetical protein C8J56DRAFT_1156768 [Mycena floridula]